MSAKNVITTDRLLIEELTLNHKHFMFELVNTDGWIRFIGNRNINSPDEALPYIQKIIDNPNVSYYVVNLSDTKKPIGVVSWIKREYLEYHDIGFALLPDYSGKGYAYEAASAVLKTILPSYQNSYVVATTIPENINSITLLKKIGLAFEKEIEIEGEVLHVYSGSTDKLLINEITHSFFGLFKNKHNKQPNWDLLNEICIPEIRLISKTASNQTVYNLKSFIEPRQKILTDGTLTEFEEYELSEQTTISHTIAQRHSEYEKQGILDGKSFKERGCKFIQFAKINGEWKISSVIWEDYKN